jgi:hypothetical protein
METKNQQKTQKSDSNIEEIANSELEDEEFWDDESVYDDYDNPDNPFHEYSDRYYHDDDPFTPEERANLENAFDK